MYSDRTYSNKALITFWVIHLIFLLIFIAILSIDMMEVAGDLGKEPAPLSAFMFFFCVALVLEPLEMVLQSYRYLEPWLYLTFQVYKCLLSTSFFIYNIVLYTQRGADEKGLWKLVLILILALLACTTITYYASLAYGAVVLRRHRKQETSDWDFVDKGGD